MKQICKLTVYCHSCVCVRFSWFGSVRVRFVFVSVRFVDSVASLWFDSVWFGSGSFQFGLLNCTPVN